MAHAAALHEDVMLPPPSRSAGAGVYNEKLGMWIFLGSEVMFFTALIGTYVILRFAHPSSWKPPGQVLNIPITAINTFLLICSSVTMVKAFAAAQDGLQRALRLWLVATRALPTRTRLCRQPAGAGSDGGLAQGGRQGLDLGDGRTRRRLRNRLRRGPG